jgi:O-acetyl-ADP-ribose deacetylase (regulator of RNase III)
VRPNLSIPLAFKEIVDTIRACHAEHLSFSVHVEDEEIVDYLHKYMPAAERPSKTYLIGSAQVVLMMGDITEPPVDAIVNAANTELKLGGGVSGAIREAAGSELQYELNRLAESGPIAPGDVVVTQGYGIRSARYILHAATSLGTEEVVRRGIRNALHTCDAKGLRSVAFPALGAGSGGLPIGQCARLFREELTAYLRGSGKPLARILVVLWTKSDFDAFAEAFDSCDQSPTGDEGGATATN